MFPLDLAVIDLCILYNMYIFLLLDFSPLQQYCVCKLLETAKKKMFCISCLLIGRKKMCYREMGDS